MQQYCDQILETLWNLEDSEELFAKAKNAIEQAIQKASLGKFSDVVRTESFTKLVKIEFNIEAPP